MTPALCGQAIEGVGNGVAASLRAVDCAAGVTAQVAFERLFGVDGALGPALTILLTLFIGFFAFALMTGRSRLGVASLTQVMMTLGAVLTFATSWVAYHQIVWNLAVGAPDQLAAIITGVKGSSTQIFADKIDIVMVSLVEAAGEPAVGETTTTFSPPGLLWLGGTLLLLGTVGVLATAKIALAVLLALGPIFVVMALFSGTRGLFVGWLKGVVMLAVTPLFAVLGGSLMLELAVPVLGALAQTPGQIDPKAAMAFFMIGAVHTGLMIMVLKVAGTMVSGWTVFGLAGGSSDRSGDRAGGSDRPLPAPAAIAPLTPEPASAAASAQRRIAIPAGTPLSAANDPGVPGAARRETRIVNTAAADHGGIAAGAGQPVSRARGIGSRFRAPSRSMERLK